MAFQKEAPIYLQVRRSELKNIGLNIVDPYDFNYIIPNIAVYINAVNDQYFFPYVEDTSFDTEISNPYCPKEMVKVFYKLDSLFVGGSSTFEPFIFAADNGVSNGKGLLTGTKSSLGITRVFNCYLKGNAPVDPSIFKIVFHPYSKEDPNVQGNYLVSVVMPTQPPISVPFEPGFVTISFVKDNPTDPNTTAPGTYLFTVIPQADIIFKS